MRRDKKDAGTRQQEETAQKVEEVGTINQCENLKTWLDIDVEKLYLGKNYFWLIGKSFLHSA